VDPIPALCPICGSWKGVRITEHNRLTIVRCLTCGHGHVWPPPSPAELDRLYSDAYYQSDHAHAGFADYAALAPARARMYGRHLDRIESRVVRGRILDVGCAMGDFLMVARARGWDTLGVDPSPARQQAQAQGLRLVGRTILDAEVAPGTLEAVTFWDVVEHLPDPVPALRRARELLKPGGVVAITVPEADNLTVWLSGSRWFGYKKAGEHLQFFARASLQRTFEAAGLTLAIRRPVPWSCTAGYLVDRGAFYLGFPGRVLQRVVLRTGLGAMLIDVPLINQFALAVPSTATRAEPARSAA